MATDLAGNTGSTSIILNRVSFPYNTNVTLSGTTSAIVTFFTDLSATGVIEYGTGISSLTQSQTGVLFGTGHTFILSSLIPDTEYFFLVK